jgi:hypothetical protein
MPDINSCLFHGCVIDIVAYVPKAITVGRLVKHVFAETNSRTNRKAVFSVRPVPRCCKKDKEDYFKSVEFRDSNLPGYGLGSSGVELELRRQNY